MKIGTVSFSLANFTFKAVLALLFFFVILYYPLSFTYEIEITYHYHLFTAALFGLFLALVNSITSRGNIRMTLIPVAVITLYIFYIITTTSTGNEHAYNICSILIVACILLTYGELNLRSTFILNLIIVVYFVELLWGIYQLSVSHRTIPMYNVNGSLHNSGIYTSFLVILQPLLFYAFFYSRSKGNQALNECMRRTKMVVFAAQLFVLCLLILVTQSRTAGVSLLLLGIAIAYRYFGNFISRFLKSKKLVPLAFGSLVIMGASLVNYIYLIKRDSVIGRLFIWNISLDHWNEGFWLGLGLGKFSFFYPQWQVSFFEGGSFSKDQFLTAGESFLAFNEYINYFKEVGIIGILALSILLRFFFLANSRNYCSLFFYIKLCVGSTLVCSITSYTLHCLPVLLVLTMCLCTVFLLNERGGGKLKKQSAAVVNFIAIALLLTTATMLVSAVQASTTVYYWRILGNENSYLRKTVPAVIMDNPKFLVRYANLTNYYGDNCEQAIWALEVAKKQATSVRIYSDLGRAYLQCSDFKNAIKHFKFVVNMVPSKFKYKIALMNAFLKSGDTAMAKVVAKEILTMPVKKASNEVEAIKKQSELLLYQSVY